MARKIVFKQDSHIATLVESSAENELELQELVKNNPDLLPIEEFDMMGPLLVVGRETGLPSGAVDLVALARSGELLIVEFKTGRGNTDFRRALAQLLDYGSDMWGMSYEQFEEVVATRFFAGSYCHDARLKGQKSLAAAGRRVWPDITLEDMNEIQDRLTRQLLSGVFHYLLVAQNFTETIQRTADYLNETMAGAKAYIVEIIRFDGDGISAFETRTILRPTRNRMTPRDRFDEEKFLEAVSDKAYKGFLESLFEVCRGLDYQFEWGTSGVAIKLSTRDRPSPLTVMWVFQPGRTGWKGLKDLNFGFDPLSAKQTPTIRSALESYVKSVSQLDGAHFVGAKDFTESVIRLSPTNATRHERLIKDILAELKNAAATAS